jgi:peroxiredoxin
VIGLAVDQTESVNKFLAKQELDFPVAMAGSGGTTLSKSLGNVAGGLPFTVVFGADGRILARKIGKVSERDLATWRDLK